jgi:hypothetical protein
VNSDFLDLLRCLNSSKVRYLVAGGYAVMKYTEPRYTKHLNIWVEPTIQNSKRLFKALLAFGAPLEQVAPTDFSEPGVLFIMGLAPSRFDILTRIKGVRFKTAWSRRTIVKVGRTAISFISIDDLIKSKLAAGRPQDLLDVKSLRTAKSLTKGRSKKRITK